MRRSKAAYALTFGIALMAISAVALAQTSGAVDPSLQLEKSEFDLGRELDTAQLDLSSAERRFAAVQSRFDAEGEPSDSLRDELQARRLHLSAAQRHVALLGEALERVSRQQRDLRRSLALSKGRVAPETLAEWQGETGDRLEATEREVRIKQARLEELRSELEFMRNRAEQLRISSSSKRWVELQIQGTDSLIQRYESDLEGIRDERLRLAQLNETLRQRSEALPLVDRLRALQHRIEKIWNYELITSEDAPVTLGKVVSALGIFLIGYLLAAGLSRLLGNRVLPRLRLDEGAVHAFQGLAFYVLLVVAFITALRMVNIPITAFAVVGGALAIGVGFGSQNVVSNFISGLILLAERPIKIGDLVELQGIYGTIERIGLRSTRVRTGDNVHIIVPNASFLENNVINWTHGDVSVRVTVQVGVVYGSPTREVERLIQQAVAEHPRALKSPVPIVLFTEFGDNSLNFEVRFWIQMRTMMERLQIESDLRFRIDDLFREANIVIAFPQRDVHLDTVSPLQVQMIQEGTQNDAG